MTSAELIARLKELDPLGTAVVIDYDGINFWDIEADWIEHKDLYTYDDGDACYYIDTYSDNKYVSSEPIRAIIL